MARLTGALFSLAASGTIADTLTFAKWKGVQYVRTRVIPANPKSTGQQEVRGVFSTLNEMWKRMPLLARQPFTAAITGLPLTARNKHIQENVAELQGDADLDDLVMSVAGGQAIPPASVVSAEVPAGSIQLTIVAPIAPVGYTIGRYDAAAVEDGDPSPVLVRSTYAGSVLPPGLVITIAVTETTVTFQWGCWVQYTRDSDSKVFYSAAVRGQQAIA
ncbi:MAG: hypothetical protein E3J25_11960 [Anaerolineales bacterium]|nr:MAG: hypothetical protein E3J25_11960 [Anaerolineales bacterium]